MVTVNQYAVRHSAIQCDLELYMPTTCAFGWGVTPRAASDRTTYTQTYTTAATTVPNATYAAPTVTVGTAIGAFTDPPSAAEMALLRTFVNALKTDNAAALVSLAALAVDVLELKKLINKLIDDAQAEGLAL